MANLLNGKTVTLDLVGQDGNAFSLLGVFSRQAKREGWTNEEIETVRKYAMSGDYSHLLDVLMDHSQPEESEDSDYDESDDYDGDYYDEDLDETDD